MPETWRESQEFKDKLRSKIVPKKEIWRRQKPGGYEDQIEYYSCYSPGKTKTYKRGYSLHWIYSSEKKKRDRESREHYLRKTEQALAVLTGKLNLRNLKTEESILNAVESILTANKVNSFYSIKVSKIETETRVQVGRGRSGPRTKYKTVIDVVYALSWSRVLSVLRKEKRVDGVFPLLCTDADLGAKGALKAYKYQPRLEKRFTQFRNAHNATPLLFKKIERVEALMFVFFMAQILQAVIERTVRKTIQEQDLDSLPIYPEHRLAHHPTTAVIFERFEQLSTSVIMANGRPIKTFNDTLTSTHKRILKMLGMTEQDYWPI